MRPFASSRRWLAHGSLGLALLTAAVVSYPARAGNPESVASETAEVFAAGTGASAVSGGDDLAAQRPAAIAVRTEGTSCAANRAARTILVDITKQRVWMCERNVQVYSTLVTTGAANVGDGTPLGTWHIQDKQTDRYLVGPGYRDFVHYWLPFDGDFGFHDAPWQTMPFGAPGYVANGSHGCVHLPRDAMSWLFGWASVGTTVTIRA